MNCPSCKTPIAGLSRECNTCGYKYDLQVFAKLSVYFELKSNLDRLISAETAFKNSLGEMSLKIKQYEQILTNDLNNLKNVIEEGKVISEEKQASIKVIQETPKIEKTVLDKPAPELVSNEEPEHFALELHLGQKWLLIVGLVTMIFGVGYFLKYSFEMGWIGPAGRVAMAYLWGIAFLVSGNLFQKRNFKNFGLYLIGGGIATLYFSTFAAFQIYHLFTQFPSFFIMVLITVLAAILAVIHDTQWLAILGIIGGFLTPLLLSTGQDNQIGLMSYMTILNLGLLAVAFYKKWDLLSKLGFVFTYLLYTSWHVNFYNQTKFWPAIIFLNIFYLIYSVIPFASQFLRDSGEKLKGFAIITPNSFIAFGYSYFMIRQHFSLEWVSVVSIGYSLVFLLMGLFLLKRGMQQKDIFTVLLGKSALFLIITVPIIFSRHWITIFWAAQAFALLWMGIRLKRKSLGAGGYILLFLSILKFLLHDYGIIFQVNLYENFLNHGFTYLIVERMMTSFFLLIIVYGFASLTRKIPSDIFPFFSKGVVKDTIILFSVWGFLLFIVLNVEVMGFFRQYVPAARFASQSVLWTLFSVALIIKGFRDKSFALRKVALGLFLVTLIKVFLFDMEHISTPYRILSFIVLGLVLVCTSYLYYRFKDRILNNSLEGNY